MLSSASTWQHDGFALVERVWAAPPPTATTASTVTTNPTSHQAADQRAGRDPSSNAAPNPPGATNNDAAAFAAAAAAAASDASITHHQHRQQHFPAPISLSTIDMSMSMPMSMSMSMSMSMPMPGPPGGTARPRPAPGLKNELYKTEMCRSYLETGGLCKYGSKCQFAHGAHELRPVRRHPRYKTKLCRNYATHGECAYGVRCRFIHAPSESSTSAAAAAAALAGAAALGSRTSDHHQQHISASDRVGLPFYGLASASAVPATTAALIGHHDPALVAAATAASPYDLDAQDPLSSFTLGLRSSLQADPDEFRATSARHVSTPASLVYGASLSPFAPPPANHASLSALDASSVSSSSGATSDLRPPRGAFDRSSFGDHASVHPGHFATAGPHAMIDRTTNSVILSARHRADADHHRAIPPDTTFASYQDTEVDSGLRLSDEFDDLMSSSRFASIDDGVRARDRDSAANFMAAAGQDPSLSTVQAFRYLTEPEARQTEEEFYFHVPSRYQSDTSPPDQRDDAESDLPNGIVGLATYPLSSGDKSSSRHEEVIKSSV